MAAHARSKGLQAGALFLGALALGWASLLLIRGDWRGGLILAGPPLLLYAGGALRAGKPLPSLSLRRSRAAAGPAMVPSPEAESAEDAGTALRAFADGVAHEVNNPLFVITGYAELLLADPERHLRSDQARRYLQIIAEQGRRAGDAVKGLAASSRDAAPAGEAHGGPGLERPAGLEAPVR